jgi:AAA+ superfamily predicted ATPase
MSGYFDSTPEDQMYNETMRDGIMCVKAAYKSDSDNDYQKAILLYESAIASFEIVLCLEKNEQNRDEIKRKLGMYASRAEALKKKVHYTLSPELLKCISPELEVKAKPKKKKKRDKSTNRSASQRKEAAKKSVAAENTERKIGRKNINVDFTSVVGVMKEKLVLENYVIRRLKGNSKYAPANVLLHGPSGNGKTLLVKQIAKACPDCFFGVSASDLLKTNKAGGDRLIKTIYQMAMKTSLKDGHQAVIVFFDEMHDLFRGNGKAKKVFVDSVKNIDKNSYNIITIGSTNRPWELNEDVAGCFGVKTLVTVPDIDERKQLLGRILTKMGKKQTSNMDRSARGHWVDENRVFFLAQMTNDMSSKSIIGLVKRAMKKANALGAVCTVEHFYEVLETAKEDSDQAATNESYNDEGFLCEQTEQLSRHKEWRKLLETDNPATFGTFLPQPDVHDKQALRREINSIDETLAKINQQLDFGGEHAGLSGVGVTTQDGDQDAPPYVRSIEEREAHAETEVINAHNIVSAVAKGKLRPIEWEGYIEYLESQAILFSKGNHGMTKTEKLKARTMFDTIDRYSTGIVDRDDFTMALRFDKRLNELFRDSLRHGVVKPKGENRR